MPRDSSGMDRRGQGPTSDLVTVLDGLTPELEELMAGEVRFLKVMPPGPVPVGLAAEDIEEIVLGLVARLRRCIAGKNHAITAWAYWLTVRLFGRANWKK